MPHRYGSRNRVLQSIQTLSKFFFGGTGGLVSRFYYRKDDDERSDVSKEHSVYLEDVEPRTM